MIASILYSSPTFEAVDYNERKVAKGDAKRIITENLGYLETSKDYNASNIRQYLIDYSARNVRIKKPQLHVSFSCKGKEMNEEELVAFSRQWLAEMGYADPKQPLLIYSHSDTDNNHIHVITSRVTPKGKKIDHSHERVRSKSFVDRTLGVDTKTELERSLKDAETYKYESISQWAAILEAAGYGVKKEEDVVKIARNGAYQTKIPIQEVEKKLSKGYAEKKRLQQLRAILTKYRDLSCDKAELKEIIKHKFGVDLVFFGGKDTPSGYFVVDHKNRHVYKGSSVLKLGELLQFEPIEEKLKRIDAFVDAQLEERPNLTVRELNALLRKHYSAMYKNGVVYYKDKELPIKGYMQQTLQGNAIKEDIMLLKDQQQQERTSNVQKKIGRKGDTQTGSSSANREYEVGNANSYGEFDDGRKFRR